MLYMVIEANVNGFVLSSQLRPKLRLLYHFIFTSVNSTGLSWPRKQAAQGESRMITVGKKGSLSAG